MAEAVQREQIGSSAASESSHSCGQETSSDEESRAIHTGVSPFLLLKPEWDSVIIEACTFYGACAIGCYCKKGGEHHCTADSPTPYATQPRRSIVTVARGKEENKIWKLISDRVIVKLNLGTSVTRERLAAKLKEYLKECDSKEIVG
jgi:hypothetical protein